MPKLLKTPFAADAAEGYRTDIQESTGVAPNSATYQIGFPPNTMQSITAGGMPPKGSDLNGVLYDITDNLVFLTQGGGYGFDSAYATSIGGYPLNAKLRLNDGTEVISTIANNTNDPNVNLTGWVKTNSASQILDESGLSQQAVNDIAKSLRKFNIVDFGYKIGSGENATQYFQAAAKAINDNGGGVLYLPYDTYIVGKQSFVAGVGYSYEKIFSIDNPDLKIVIKSDGAKIKFADGLRFGAFDVNTGAPLNTPNGYIGPGATNIGYAFDIWRARLFSVLGSIEVDGNDTNMIIGGRFGDTGTQCIQYGFVVKDVPLVYAENVYCHHSCLDGFYLGGVDTTESSNVNVSGTKHQKVIINLVSEYNGRQALTIGGGSNYTFIGGSLSHTGQSVMQSQPMSGCDIETEAGSVHNVKFYGTVSTNNRGSQLLTVGDVYDVAWHDGKILQGENNASCIYGNYNGRNVRFYDCSISGVNTALGVSGANFVTPDSFRFYRCTITDDVKVNPYISSNYSFNRMFDSSNPIYFEDCDFNLYRSGMFTTTVSKYGVLKDTTVRIHGNTSQFNRNFVFYQYFDGLTVWDLRDNVTENFTPDGQLCRGRDIKIVSPSPNSALMFYGYGASYKVMQDAMLPSYKRYVDNGERPLSKYIQASRTGTAVTKDSYFTILPSNSSTPNDNDYYVIGDIICNSAASSSSWLQSICTKTGYANTNNWAANTAYALNAQINANGNVYICVVAGTTQGTTGGAPIGTSNGQVDGTVTWNYVGAQAEFRVSGAQASGLSSTSTAADIVAALKAAGLAT